MMSYNGAFTKRGSDPYGLSSFPSSVDKLNTMMIRVAAPLGSREGGARIVLPAGTMVIDKPIKIPNHVDLEGHRSGTVLQASSSFVGDAMVMNLNDSDRRFALRDITLDGNGVDVSGISFTTPAVSGNEYADGMWKIDQVAILSVGLDAIHVSGRGEGKGTGIEIRDAGGYGIIVDSVDNDFIGVTVGNSGKAGIKISYSNNRIENCKVYYCGYTDAEDGHGFWFDGVTDGAVLATAVNCEAQDCSGHGFYVENFDHVDLVGVIADSNGAGHNEQSFTGHGFVLHNADYAMLRGRARDRNVNDTRQQRGLLLSGWTSIASVDLMASGNEAGSTSNTTGNTISGRVNGVVGNIS